LESKSDAIKADFPKMQAKNIEKVKKCYVLSIPEVIEVENTTITEVNEKHDSQIPLLPMPSETPQGATIMYQHIGNVNQVYNDVRTQNQSF
jgi:hypothetical protein